MQFALICAYTISVDNAAEISNSDLRVDEQEVGKCYTICEDDADELVRE